LLTPIAVFGGDRPGKTVLLIGGNHGDEFEGPAALRRVIYELEPNEISGRVIIVPGLNQAALKAGQRLSPIDDGNLNRSFPGDPRGTPTQRVANFVYRELVSRADVVLDLHSGGRSMVFAPMVATHDVEDPEQAFETGRYLRAFGTPLAASVSEPDGIGLLDTAVEELGKVFLTTEIHGGASISAATTGIAYRGIVNTLKVAGILAGEPTVHRPPAFVQMIDGGTVLATSGGLLEPAADPGDEVRAGDLVARIHHLDDLAICPTEVTSPATGIVVLRHSSGLIDVGDPVVSVAVPGLSPWEGGITNDVTI
jgi:N-alpha-acetyl-L-2,4-diaminobutyrate deacetylase